MAEVVNSLHDDVAPQDAPVGPARMTEVVNSLHDAPQDAPAHEEPAAERGRDAREAESG